MSQYLVVVVFCFCFVVVFGFAKRKLFVVPSTIRHSGSYKYQPESFDKLTRHTVGQVYGTCLKLSRCGEQKLYNQKLKQTISKSSEGS